MSEQLTELSIVQSQVADGLLSLGFTARVAHDAVLRSAGAGGTEAALQAIGVDFDALPLITEGNSKVVRRWTYKLVLLRLKPTVYSYSYNRVGNVPGTDRVRALFTADVYRRMSSEMIRPDGQPCHAFVGLIHDATGPLLVQREVDSCNLEVRVKRYHIGSPLHRYKGTEAHPSILTSGPVRRWTRFESPVVCFDWRHPMFDETGGRLADEPLSDDYAALWMENTASAKTLARDAFLWLEAAFRDAGLLLIDICFFIDRSGRRLYGEISPDCMRARIGVGDVATLDSVDKDVWRQGRSEEELLARYSLMLERFSSSRPV